MSAPWGSEKKKSVACDGFHPYTSNPLLCKCGHPVQEHTKFMTAHLKKLANAEQERRQKIIDGVLEVLGIDLVPDPGDEIIEVSPEWKMKRREYEALRRIVLAQEEERKKSAQMRQNDALHARLLRWREEWNEKEKES